jgi:AraC family transcriptional regulator
VDMDLGGLEAVRKCLEASYSEAHTIDDLAELAQLSRFHFIRKFKRHFGCTPFEYLHFVRMNRAMQMLVSGNFKVTDVALEVGFNDISFFLYKFKQHYGKSPGQVCGTKICTPPASLPIL